MSNNESIRIGRIYACIDGDHRYGITLEVRRSGDAVQVVQTSTSPDGGMDGPGGTSDDREIAKSWELSKLTPAELISYLRRAFKSVDGGTIARYGKPTKRFTWYTADGEVQGFSAALAERALTAAAAS